MLSPAMARPFAAPFYSVKPDVQGCKPNLGSASRVRSEFVALQGGSANMQLAVVSLPRYQSLFTRVFR